MAGQRGLPLDARGHELVRVTVDDDCETSRWRCRCGESGTVTGDEDTATTAHLDHMIRARESAPASTRWWKRGRW